MRQFLPAPEKYLMVYMEDTFTDMAISASPDKYLMVYMEDTFTDMAVFACPW